MFEEFYIQSISYVCQRPVGSIEQHVRTCVVLWSYPLSFQNSPKGFGDVKMWRVWRQEEEKETSLFPSVNSNTFGFPITNNITGIPYIYFT